MRKEWIVTFRKKNVCWHWFLSVLGSKRSTCEVSELWVETQKVEKMERVTKELKGNCRIHVFSTTWACLSIKKSPHCSEFSVQLQWPVSTGTILQGNNFNLNIFFLRVHYQSLDCMYTHGHNILGLQGTSNYYAKHLPLLALVKHRDNYNLIWANDAYQH